MGNWTNWTGAGDTIAAGPGWVGLGWVSGTAATESREKNAMNSYSQTPPRPALQSAALTHFQQETSHGCSLNTAGDVTAQGRDQEMEECKVRGGADMLHNAEPGHSQGC